LTARPGRRPALVVAMLILLAGYAVLPLRTHRIYAAGTTYYVSRAGTNGDGLSWTTAWSNLDTINWAVIQPGDTIVIDGGATPCASPYDFSTTRPGVSCGMLYNSTLTVGTSGTATAPVTIRLATDSG